MALLLMRKWQLLIAGLLLGLPLAVQADPVTIVESVLYLVPGLWTIGATAITALSWAIVIGAAVGYSNYQSRKAKQKARDAWNDSLEDRLVMQALISGQRSRIYGRVRNVDGVVFKASHGANNEIYTFVIAIAGHPIDAFETIFFDDLPVTLDEDGYVLTAPYSKVSPTTAIETFPRSDGAFSITLAHPPINAVGLFSYTSFTTDGGTSSVPVPLTISGSTVSGIVDTAGYGDNSTGSGTLSITYQWANGTQKARVRTYTGYGSGPGADLMADLPDVVKSTDRFDGMALLRVDLTYDQDAFPSGVPSISAVVRGTRVYDPRTGLTAWSNNPALCARDWALQPNGGALTADVIDDASVIAAANACDVSTTFSFAGQPSVTAPLFVCGTVARTDQDPWTTFNEIVESMAGKAGWPGGKLRIRAGVYTAPVAGITEDWLSGADSIQIVPEPPTDEAVNIYTPTIANGVPTSAGNAVGYVTSTDYAVGAKQIVVASGSGTIPAGEYVAFGSGTDYYALDNGVATAGDHLTLAAPGLLTAIPAGTPIKVLGDLKTAYVAAPVPDVRADAYVTLDGRELQQDTTLSAVTDVWHAQHVCGVMLRDSRNGLTCTLPCNLRAFQLEMFDVVTVTLPRFGWSAKTFEVLGWQFNLTGGVTLTLKETAASIFQVDAGFSLIDQTPNTNLPSPFNVPMVTGLAAASGTAQLQVLGDGTVTTRILVTWDPITDEAVLNATRDGVVVRYGLSSQDPSQWETATFPARDGRGYLTGVQDQQFYLITALARNSLVSGIECPPILHFVLGKSEPPPDVSNFTVFENDNGNRQYFWSYLNAPVDLRGFTVKYAPSIQEAPWSGMIPLFDAGALERTRESAEPPDGEYTIAIKAVDTSGNESVNPYSIAVLLEGNTVGNASYMRRPHELGWPGIKVDCYVDGYILDALSVETWDTVGGSLRTWDAWTSWRGTSRSPIQYVDETLDTLSVQTARLRCAAWATDLPLAEYQSSVDGSVWTDWAVVPTDAVTLRYLRVRWTVAGGDPQLYRAQIALYI